MNRDEEVILNQAICIFLLFREISKLTGLSPEQARDVVLKNAAKVRKDLDETARMTFLQQAELETSFIQDYEAENDR